MATRVLEENWDGYDLRKRKAGLDPCLFACTEPWEVAFMIKIIRVAYPAYTQANIQAAIEGCCLLDKGPHLRAIVVECVLRRLRLN